MNYLSSLEIITIFVTVMPLIIGVRLLRDSRQVLSTLDES